MSEKLMSEKYPPAAAPYEPAMTFAEIGRQLGITREAARFLFVRALKKLRKQPETKQWAELVAQRSSLANQRQWTEPDWGGL